jgi:hypothetical protein
MNKVCLTTGTAVHSKDNPTPAKIKLPPWRHQAENSGKHVKNAYFSPGRMKLIGQK